MSVPYQDYVSIIVPTFLVGTFAAVVRATGWLMDITVLVRKRIDVNVIQYIFYTVLI